MSEPVEAWNHDMCSLTSAPPPSPKSTRRLRPSQTMCSAVAQLGYLLYYYEPWLNTVKCSSRAVKSSQSPPVMEQEIGDWYCSALHLILKSSHIKVCPFLAIRNLKYVGTINRHWYTGFHLPDSHFCEIAWTIRQYVRKSLGLTSISYYDFELSNTNKTGNSTCKLLEPRRQVHSHRHKMSIGIGQARTRKDAG